jgi:hypothetical protein
MEAGREMASGIPGARFVTLPGRNHPLLQGEPATDRFLEGARAVPGKGVSPTGSHLKRTWP